MPVKQPFFVRYCVYCLNSSCRSSANKRRRENNPEYASISSDHYFSLAIGFNVETVQYKNIRLQVWDLGGQSSIRPYWRCYYPNTNAIIYVVDSNDRERINDAKVELQQLLAEEELKGVTLLVFANKMDLPNAMNAAEVSTGLGLVDIRDRQYAIFQSSATQGHGVNEGLDWLVTVLSSM